MTSRYGLVSVVRQTTQFHQDFYDSLLCTGDHEYVVPTQTNRVGEEMASLGFAVLFDNMGRQKILL